MLSRLMYKPHISCLSSDILIQNDKILTKDTEINKILTNGAEVYCIDTSESYLYDEENKTLIKTKVNDDILVDGEITPESITLINNKVDNFIDEVNEKIEQADIDKIVELENKMGEFSNPNILINSYFANPVNQRNKKTYTEHAKYTIDRWIFKHSGDGNTLTIKDGYISLSNTTPNNMYLEYLYDTDIKMLEGKKVTFTIKYKSTATFRLNSFIPSEAQDANIYMTPTNDWTIKSITLDLSSWKYSKEDKSSVILQSFDGSSFTNGTLDIEWVKLELGDVSTPFTPRPYAEELALCQRYYYGWGNERARFRAVGVNGNQLFFFIPLPTTLRITPTITNAFVINSLSGALINDFTFAANQVPMGLIVHATKNTHGLADGQLMLDDDKGLDSEIY